ARSERDNGALHGPPTSRVGHAARDDARPFRRRAGIADFEADVLLSRARGGDEQGAEKKHQERTKRADHGRASDVRGDESVGKSATDSLHETRLARRPRESRRFGCLSRSLSLSDEIEPSNVRAYRDLIRRFGFGPRKLRVEVFAQERLYHRIADHE